MTEEEKNEQEEAAAADETAEGGEAEPAAEAPAEEPAAEEPAAEEPAAEEPAAEEAPAEEPAAEEPAAEEPAAEEAPAADAEAPAGEAEAPAEQLGPKERRKRSRSQHTGEARPPRTPEERIAERAERRRKRAGARRSYRAKQRGKGGERTPVEPLVAKDESTGRRRVRQGVVVSAKPDKTITVRIDITRRHRQYKKIVREFSTLHAHDERNEAGEGDTVRVIESRPLSRTKRWRLVEVVEKAR